MGSLPASPEFSAPSCTAFHIHTGCYMVDRETWHQPSEVELVVEAVGAASVRSQAMEIHTLSLSGQG